MTKRHVEKDQEDDWRAECESNQRKKKDENILMKLLWVEESEEKKINNWNTEQRIYALMKW